MKLNNNHEDIIKILNNNKDKIEKFELLDDFFIIRFTDGSRVEVEAERDCGIFATHIIING